MTREEIIRNLEYTMEKHKNDTVATFGTNISLMCRDILDYLEQEPCEDAISRAAAIKAMDDLEQEDIERYGCSIPEGFDGKRAIEALQSLPSVNPVSNISIQITEREKYGRFN